MNKIIENGRVCRRALDDYIETIKDETKEVNENSVIIRPWKPAIYVIGAVRSYEGIPYKCCQGHNSTENPDWVPPTVPALWAQYHGTSPETARPFVQPAGAHDMYQADEYMIWTDEKIYKCVSPTTYTPEQYAQAWEVIE